MRAPKVQVGNRDAFLFTSAANHCADRIAEGRPCAAVDGLAIAHLLNARLPVPLPARQVDGKRHLAEWGARLAEAGARIGAESRCPFTPEQRSRGGQTRAWQQWRDRQSLDRAAHRLRKEEGLTYRAIARMQGCSPSTAWRRVHRARAVHVCPTALRPRSPALRPRSSARAAGPPRPAPPGPPTPTKTNEYRADHRPPAPPAPSAPASSAPAGRPGEPP